MEKKTIGKFISALRKANGMTQKELGEKLFVSDKTVSRWECDECTPELSLIPLIAEIFGITTDELLRGERNNSERDASSEKTSYKKKIKNDKLFKLILHEKIKKFINLSFISIGIIIVGLIVAMICNLGFSKGVLGFCLASIFFVAATICQMCFTVSFRLLIDEEYAEYSEEIKKANNDMVFSSVKIFFGILLAFAFCLPIAVLTLSHFNSQYGIAIDSWIMFGILFAAVAFLIAFCVYKIFVLKALMRKEIVCLDEMTVGRVNTESKLLGKICITFTIVLAIIILATDIITSYISESSFIEREKFDDPDKFIEYMQSEYDAWYNEGYGDLPINERPPHENIKKFSEIDGKEYYYNPFLYETIHILKRDNGEWEIVVVTYEANQNGEVMYSILNSGLLTLHIINFVVCIVWYIIKTRKHKKV